MFRKIFLTCFFASSLLYFSASFVSATNFYVSKNGNNSSGTSWSSAWNELDQINWSSVNPGDTVYVDGSSTACSRQTTITNSTAKPTSDTGNNCGMTYTTMLDPEKAGTATNPITIKLSTESGRNGTAIFFGGRSTSLPYCGQTNYTYRAGLRQPVDLRGKQNLTIDGIKWGGIKIYGGVYGVTFNSTSNNLTLKHLEIFDNGKDGPNLSGVNMPGSNITIERSMIHNNGQDAIDSGGGTNHFTLKQSWLYNSRPHPTQTNEPFNYCTHSDGIQVYNGRDQYDIHVEDSIIGPGFMQGLLLGDHVSNWAIATVHNFTLKNSLLVGYHGSSNNALIYTKYDPNSSYPNNPPTNYLLDHVTAYKDPDRNWWNIQLHGSGHTISYSCILDT
ncbi:hypothetical protein ACFL2V_09740 [Pseudomonadota bacterium]